MSRAGILDEAMNPAGTVLLIPLTPCVRRRQSAACDADAREGNVLRIIITETPREIRWILQGRLFGPQVTEVKGNWRTANRIRKGRACIVDLEGLTFMDKRGKRLLRVMSRDGAQFIAGGVHNGHLIEELNISGKRGLSWMIASFLRLSRRCSPNKDQQTGASTELNSS
ncbi:MAG: hypothetical protein WAN14_03715 [Candidatus Acidiferrales bacterium]